SSTLLQARNDRYINDVLASPMHPWQMNLGYAVGGFFRSIAIGAALVAIALPLTGVPIDHPFGLLLAVILLVALFGGLGTVVGIYAQTFDHHSFINNILILPLTFLGGVFYSINILPSPWQELSHLNPLFYMVNAVRYGFLGTSDVSVALSFGITAVIAAGMLAWAQWLFSSGHKLKP
ncbi:MAG: ABC transporter permease, partial [Solirubrobacterales bacterium]|nr:ABC transporter permease [Solirubrobacterales bacterium]